MLSKIVLIFLAFIAVLGVFGKLHWIGVPKTITHKCKACGRYRIGKEPCNCKDRNG